MTSDHLIVSLEHWTPV